MPKEITHISLAKDLETHLDPSSLFHGPVNANSNLFLYGAVAPDSCYYYLAGPHSRFIQNQSQKYHTADPSSLAPVLRLLNKSGPADSKALAFAAGLSCHLIADTIFHPIVYYFSGIEGLHPGADTRHRTFETALDLYFKNKIKLNNKISIGHILKTPGMCQKDLINYFETMFSLESGRWRPCLSLAVKAHQISCFLFQNSLAARLCTDAPVTSAFFPEEHKALFYPKHSEVNHCFFDHTIQYQHPVTGRFFNCTITDLIKTARQQTLSLLAILEHTLLSGPNRSKSHADILEHPDLPTVQPCLPQKGFKFWYNQADLRKKLYKRHRP